MKKDKHQFLQYTLTTDIYKADLKQHLSKNLLPEMDAIYARVTRNDKNVVVTLLELIRKHPEVPQFKNFLSSYYALRGEREKAFETNNQLLKQFPDYLYALLNQANFYLAADEPEKVPGILGTTLELSDLYPERKIFHHEEYFNFYETVGRYYCHIHEPEKAEAILENLNEVADLLNDDREFENLEDLLFGLKLQNEYQGSFKNNKERTEPTLPQVTEPPVFHYPQINWLYQYGMNELPDKKIHEILSLEKEFLRTDLETVIFDAIKRYDHFDDYESDINVYDFCLHALYLLKEIKAEESLPVVLELLRQPEALLDLYLMDSLIDNIWQVLYTLGINRVDKLADFLKEPLNHTFARSEISVALTQILLHHPEKRKEITSLYKEVINFYISNKTDETIADDSVTGLMIGDIIEFNGKELLPEIQRLYDEDLVDESMAGSLQEIITELNKIPAGETAERHKKSIQDYFEIASEFTLVMNDEEKDELEEEDELYDDWEEMDEDDTDYFYSGDKPFVREMPKVGRNEPCPCGSGKKYKNCHGID
ncbi:MAG TPA: DUF1186 domain-containing protein [Parafilimonas sp.]|nr:DUF1186 domain-containing protein [Parafilimonas sp.]